MQPERVFHYFEEISQIPRCTGNEKAISDYLINFGKEHGLKTYRDDLNNVILKKDGTDGYESADPVVLQGHMDMVCEKTDDSDHDFKNDPIDLQYGEKYLTAKDTTLGADDGIAIAMALAILESDKYSHPPLELLVTTSEETDMSGALGLEDDVLEGEHLINIDSEEEGILTVGSAGGVTLFLRKKIEREPATKDLYKISFSGLEGGHSGMQIDENRGNMLKIMGEFLENAMDKGDRIASIRSGTLDNAIPRSGEVTANLSSDPEKTAAAMEDKYADLMGNLAIDIEKANRTDVFTEGVTKSILTLLSASPTGVNSYVGDGPDVESSNNLALIREDDGDIYLENSLRSSDEEVLESLLDDCIEAAEKAGFRYETGSEYPSWAYKEDSPLRDLAQKVYREEYGKEFETIVVHAGLECGAISSKYPSMDMISIGPEIEGAHTTKERLNLASTDRVFRYILSLLKEMK